MMPEKTSSATSLSPAVALRMGKPWRRQRWPWGWLFIVLALLYAVVAFVSIGVDWQRVSAGSARALALLQGFFSPDFGSRAEAIISGILDSLAMALTATVVGVVLSIPVALGAAHNLAPWPIFYFCRGFIVLARAFPEIILAIFFVVMVGFGSLAGFLTLVLATMGFMAKLLAEALEEIDPAPVEALKAVGAPFLAWVHFAVQPQVLPRFWGLSLYRLDINFRESAIIGLVGAGGIGATLNTSLSRYEYATAAAILLIIIVLVFLAEVFSNVLRERIHHAGLYR